MFRGLGSHNPFKSSGEKKKKEKVLTKRTKKQILNEVREFNQKEGAQILEETCEPQGRRQLTGAESTLF